MPARRSQSTSTGIGSGVLLVLASCASLQVGSAFATTLFPAFGPAGTTALRLLLAAVIMMAVRRPRMLTWNRRQWMGVIGFGVMLTGMNAAFYEAISRIPIGIAVSIEFLGPLGLAAVLSRRWKDALWIALAVVGIGQFFLDDFLGEAHLDLVGVAFVLVAGAFWAGYIIMSEKVGQLVPGTGGLAAALAVGGVLMLPFGVQTVPTIVQAPSLLLPIVLTAVLASLVPYSLEFAALRKLPKSVFGILLSVEPVLASIVGFVLLGQGMTVLGMTAICIVVVASAGSTLTARRAARRTLAAARSSDEDASVQASVTLTQ